MWVTLFTWLENALRWIRAGWPTDYLPPLVALAAFLLSLWTYRSAKQRERFKLGIDLILKLGERFESEVMLKHRAAAAEALMAGDTKINLSVDAVFDFFEDVGFLLRRGAIDVEAIETFFSYWLKPYYRAWYVYRARRPGNAVWNDFPAVGERVERFEDWRNSSWPWQWTHYAAWHIWRKRNPANRWGKLEGELGTDVEKVFQEERQLVPCVEAGWVYPGWV